MAKSTVDTLPGIQDDRVVLSREVRALLGLPGKGQPYVVERSWLIAALEDTIVEAEACVRLFDIKDKANAA